MMYRLPSVSLAASISAALLTVFTLQNTSACVTPQTPVTKSSQDADVGNETSFENEAAGSFAVLNTQLGKWTTHNGTALIDNQHAATGQQCLQLTGGTETSVELELADGIRTDGQLSFRAERWTRQEPFSFRIEKRSHSEWVEIYNGEKQILVGRSFLSDVRVSLKDAQIDRLRFTVISPPNKGLLIDDLRISPGQPQKIVKVEIVPFALPVLVGPKQSPLLKLKIETAGHLSPLSLTQIAATLDGTTDVNDIGEVRAYFGGNSNVFAPNTAFGEAVQPSEKILFTGHQELLDGTNCVWLTCGLQDNSDIDHRAGAAIQQLTFSNGQTFDLSGQPPTVNQIGVSVRAGGDDGVHTYRIPGLATTKTGSLIAVYDVRHRSSIDLPGDIDVGMSRSTDGGRTWHSMQIIMNMGNDPNFRYEGIGDPCVLVDSTTGTIWCAATWSHGDRSWRGSGPGLEPAETGQFILVKSDDDGVTWSNPINITRQVKMPEWSFLLQGPGKGITMSDGTLVFPAQYQDPPHQTDKIANRLPHSAFIYSRDHGKTWATSTGAYDDTTEAQVIELADRQLMINCRYNRDATRVVMTTADMGKTWTQHSTNRRALIEPGACMASLINVGRELRQLDAGGPYAKGDDFLLFSNPDSIRERSHITIKASLDGGQTWPAGHQLLLDEQQSAGYSCLTMIDAETVGIIYEGSQAQMTFQRIKITDILNPPLNQKTRNPEQVTPSDRLREK